MYAFSTVASFTLILAARLAQASVYVIDPIQTSSCTGGQSCEVQWVDNGEAPLLSTIGECDVGLYTGQFVQVQSLPSVDVSTTNSFTFTPDPSVGPNGQYYLVFTASGINYQGFSGSFTLGGMSGTTPTGGSTTPTGSATPTTSVPSGTSATAPSTTPTTTATTPSSSSSTTKTSTTTSQTSSSPSATASGAAISIGSSTSLGGIAAVLALSGLLAL
ncbi:hypothetical protein JVU11DRAFT_9876 [Chiua virens]|nr:hypothetical protein JVU11DRAFT_12045 [Chiua virens]KAG9310230.1 hypothetical protein JVU11DRAFT_9876 [Chiua virens]